LIFVVLIVGILLLFAIKHRSDKIREARYNYLLLYGYSQKRTKRTGRIMNAEKRFDIAFNDLGLVLPTGVQIMKGVTGELKSGRLCAIIGPSGAGKTSFVNLLTGKATKTSGTVAINGMEESLAKYKKLTGFVPQDDIMHRELTVIHNLTHSAMMRLPATMLHVEKTEKVLQVIKYLELGHVMDSIIGDETRRGISGGQRRRVSIGMELVANPSILFLDEPTSGLDSATSLEVCTLLKNIAHEQKLTVAAVIHSPSAQSFAQFDDVMILGAGGQLVYFGAVDAAPAYFERIGFPIPAGENPADFYLAVASAKVPSMKSPDFVPADLFVYWERFKQGKEPAQGKVIYTLEEMLNYEKALTRVEEDAIKENQVTRTAVEAVITGILSMFVEAFHYVQGVTSEFVWWIVHTIVFWRQDRVRKTPNGFIAFWLLFKRASMQLYSSRTQFIHDQLLHLGCGAFISIACQKFDYMGRMPQDVCNVAPVSLRYQCENPIDQISQVGVFISLGVCYAGISVGSSTFGSEKVIYWRECASGMSTLPYYIAKVLADLPRIFIASVCFTLSFIMFFNYRSYYATILLVVFLLYCNAFAMGYFTSAIVKRESVGLVGTAMALLWAIVFSGVVPDLEELATSSSFELYGWLWGISAPRWAIEAFFLKEVEERPFFEIHQGKLPHTYRLDHFGMALWYVLAIAGGWNLGALLMMKLMNRDKHT
jgi:ABC-type multidrug transport system ATPase subunit